MRRPATIGIFGLLFAFSVGSARAETPGPNGSGEMLELELAELQDGPAAELVPNELSRVRELLDLAARERAAGRDDSAEGVLSLVPLQLRLIGELLRASELEAEADRLEGRVIELDQRTRVAREQLDEVLARLLGLRYVREGR